MADEKNTPDGSGGDKTVAFVPIPKEELLDVLRNVHDPDLQMNVVDLGLIYDVQHQPDGRVHVRMTLTSPHCPYGPALVGEIKAMLMLVKGVAGVQVDIVWDPPWSADKMTEAARLALGLDL